MAFAAPTLGSETLMEIAGFPIRNSMVMAWIAMILLIIVAIVYKRKSGNLVPRGLQNFMEMLIEGLFNFFNSITQDAKLTRRFFPVVATIFFFVIASNWLGIFPGVGSIGIKEGGEEAVHEEIVKEEPVAPTAIVPVDAEVGHPPAGESAEAAVAEESEGGHEVIHIFRTGYADVNMTLALALISVFMTQYFGIKALGFFGYAGKFFVNPFRDPIGFFVGILEFISEFAKLISFSFRLFGNIFAGEVLLVVIGFLAPFIAPLPFYGLEIFVGFVQALVFALLTLVFMKNASTAH
ncbi:F0F1 ATP synthase subunit A [Candidatus Gracilibacteria bacterium]|nr:F0F1 ATP synthase subunit A [Candidatus Gracilibacteria bacterium]